MVNLKNYHFILRKTRTNILKMLNIKGRLNKKGEIVFPLGKSLEEKTQNEEQTPKLPSGINIELTVSIDVNSLISGIDGFVWATKDICQAEIISNALKVQKFDVEIVHIELEKNSLYLIQVNRREDVKQVIDFIQNDVGGLRLKPDWNYPEGERNQSFEQWINE
jgi:hypothetical protein